MIYTPENTACVGEPITVTLNGKKLENLVYLDRRRRVYRQWETDDQGAFVIVNGQLKVKESRYSHRQKMRVIKNV